jgi:chaperonin GroES
MPEMPIDPEFGRFIAGITETEDGGALVDMEEDEMEVEELEDGSAIVRESEFKGPEEDEEFYANLAESLNDLDLQVLASKYLRLFDKDKEDRKERDKQYEDGLRRTGLGNDAPGGANFNGASKVVHPVMAEACVDFAARAIKELFPPDGPTRTKIVGEVTPEKTDRAERKRDYMNWQLTEQIEEYRDEQEQMFTQLPMGGSQYMKMWYDEQKRRPCSEFVPIDNILLPFAASNFYTAQRATEMMDITEYEFRSRVDRGLYRDVELIGASLDPEPTGPEKANNKIEGRSLGENIDGVRRVYHCYTHLELEDDPRTKGKMAPYILMIDELDSEVVGLYRNWEEGDESMTKLDWIVEFKFIPWRGAYAIGLPHLIGGLSAALTGALRALLDTAHINNSATMIKLKGAKVSGQSDQIEVTEVKEIEAAPGVDDIRKVAMPLPFNPPSPVLMELLGWLTQAAKGVITTSEEKIADVSSQAPVGTTLAMIEQGASVFSAIHARLHESQKRVLMILGRINRWYLDDQAKGDVVADLEISREDFERNSDVIPVSDPHIFSESQRMAQTQMVISLMDKYPQLFDPPAVIQRILKQAKIPNVNELMPTAAKPIEAAASDENAAMALGKPAFAYPRQDHLAHLQTHLDFAKDPIFGSNPLFAQKFIPQVIEHCKQHMMLWYTNQINQYATSGTQINLQKYAEIDAPKEIDRTVAVASQHVAMDSQQVFEQVLPVLQQLSQQLQQMTQAQAEMQKRLLADPQAQAVLESSLAETQRRAARDQADIALKKDEQQIDIAKNAEDNLTKERIATAKISFDADRLRKEQEDTAISLQQAAQRTLGRL